MVGNEITTMMRGVLQGPQLLWMLKDGNLGKTCGYSQQDEAFTKDQPNSSE